MGVIPTTVQATEIPQAFSTGIIDLMFTSTPDRRHHPRLGVHPLLLRHRRLGAEERGAGERGRVRQAAGRRAEGASPTPPRRPRSAAGSGASRRTTSGATILGKNGLKIEPITPQFKAELRKIGDTMLNDWLAKAGDDGKKVVAEYRKRVPQ